MPDSLFSTYPISQRTGWKKNSLLWFRRYFSNENRKNCHTNIQICCISLRKKKSEEKIYDFGLGWFDECLHWILYRSCNETLKWMIFYVAPIPYRPKDGTNYQWNKYFFSCCLRSLLFSFNSLLRRKKSAFSRLSFFMWIVSTK